MKTSILLAVAGLLSCIGGSWLIWATFEYLAWYSPIMVIVGVPCWLVGFGVFVVHTYAVITGEQS